MRVRELLDLLNQLPDDTLVVVAGDDHSYRVADAGEAVAVCVDPKRRRPELYQYFGNPNEIDFKETPDAELVTVLVVL